MPTFDEISGELQRQAIELPSWALGNSGTRFEVFTQPGVPRLTADAAGPTLEAIRAGIAATTPLRRYDPS